MLISFEGIDGCGKTTQIQLLQQRLEREKIPVQVLREPGGAMLSEMIRSILLNPEVEMNAVTELLLFSAARSELVASKVNPLLADKVIVILDRYFDSTVAYQGFGRGSLPIGHINQLNEIASHGREPDITFLLDIEVEEARRRRENDEPDRMERAGDPFYERVRDGFLYLAEKKSRFVTLEATLPPKLIHQDIWQHISAMLR